MYNRINRILKTLPIGYYMGRSLKVKLDAQGTSTHIDMVTEEITISAPMVIGALTNTAGNADMESTIRGLLYHEVSHAILTPRNLFEWLSGISSKDIINIFEDERIETTNRNYFMNVNFIQNLYNINGAPREPKSFEEFFFNIVRFNYGPKHLVKMKNDTMKEITNPSIIVTTSTKQNDPEMYRYTIKFGRLVTAIKNEWNQPTPPTPPTPPTNPGPGGDGPEGPGGDGPGGGGASVDDVKKIINKALSNMDHKYDNKVHQSLEKMIDDFEERNGMKHTIHSNMGRNAHSSGKFSTKLLVKDIAREKPTYNWFEHKKPGNKKIDNLVLNLWLDYSGSYKANAHQTKEIINAIKKIKQSHPYFEYNIIVMVGNSDILGEIKDDYYVEDVQCSSSIDGWEVAKTYKKVCHDVYRNIILIDGYCWSINDEYLKVFMDNKTVTIIDDRYSSTWDSLVPTGKKIIIANNDYPNKLKEEVVKVLQTLFY